MSLNRENIQSFARVPVDEADAGKHPRYCVWELTLQCDLGCIHCGSRAGRRRKDELTTAECLNVVRQLHDIGIKEVTLIGGEAYLREDWDMIAREITRQGMVCGMTTGGRNLSADRIERAVNAGIQSISISIDGLEQTHDALRFVPGSWNRAMSAAARIAASPIRLTFNTQINRRSLPELSTLADVLIAAGMKAWQIQLTVPMGRAADQPDLILQPYDLLILFPMLVQIKQQQLTPYGVELFPGNNIGYFGPYESILRYGGAEGAYWQGCSAGKWSIGIEANGTIKGCPSLPTNAYSGGSVRERTLAETLSSSEPVKRLRMRTVADLWGYCRTCYYAEVCLAGCSWTSHVIFGRPGNNPLCIHRALEHQAKGLYERLVQVERAPGEPFDHGRFDIKVENDNPDFPVR